MDAFLQFFITNLAVIIQWLIAIIMLILGVWFALLIVGRGQGKSEKTLGGTDLGNLETVLKEIAAKGMPALNSVGKAADASAALSGVGNASMEKIMQELAQKEAEIQMLKKNPPGPNASSADLTSYLEKIRDLEGKLAEYEIIEDDIADLSLYKEENARLKRQLEELGSTAGSNLASAAAAKLGAEMSAPAAGEKGEDLVREFAAAVQVGGDAVKKESPQPSSGLSADLQNDLAVLSEVAKEPVIASPAPTAKPIAEEAADDGANDILAEFTKTLTGSIPELNKKSAKASADKFSEEGSEGDALDTDKMLAEMAALESVAPTDDDPSALEEGVDTEKMAAEANKLISGDS